LVEGPEKTGVSGSIPSLATINNLGSIPCALQDQFRAHIG
jgi:hypothetical protein